MGIYGYPPPEGARVAVRTVAEHLGGETALELVRFVLFSDETYELFADALAELSPARGRPVPRRRCACLPPPLEASSRTDRRAVPARRPHPHLRSPARTGTR